MWSRLTTAQRAFASRNIGMTCFTRYGNRKDSRFFVIAEEGDTLLGCIFGEVRSWEFNSVPCGWVGTVSVEPNLRMGGIGQHSLQGNLPLFPQGRCDQDPHHDPRAMRPTLCRSSARRV